MKICLFGSAFDPVHLGHQYMAQQMLAQGYCEQVWFVPVNQHPFGKEVVANGRRVEMLEKIVEPGMRIEPYELEQTGKSYSLQTLRHLAAQYPEHHFSWLIGADNLEHFHKWYGYQELLSEFPVYVFPRKGYALTPWYEGMHLVEGVNEVDISSTQVRNQLRQGHEISDLVDPRVVEYIEKNGLYGC